MPANAPPRDVILTGPHAPELAAALRWPDLGDGCFGYKALPSAAVALRVLSARRAASQLQVALAFTDPTLLD